MGIFSPDWDVKIEPNRLHLSDRGTGQSVWRDAVHPFSCNNLLVESQTCLEQEFRELVVEFAPRRRWLVYPRVHISMTRRVTAVEVAAIKSAFLDAGAAKVFVSDQE